MKEVLLSNKIYNDDYSSVKQRIFFQLGSLNELEIRSAIKGLSITEDSELTFKKEGIELNVLTQSIPLIVKALTDNGIPIYSITSIYNPKL